MERKIAIYEDHFVLFYSKQSQKVKDKIDYVLDLIRSEKRVPKKFLKFLTGTDGLYEIRVTTSFSNIRIFCFFDEGKLVILTNCFIKKTPKKELELAKKLKEKYFNNKKAQS